MALGLIDFAYKLGAEVLAPIVTSVGIPQPVVVFVMWLHCYATATYFGMGFVLTSWDRSIIVYSAMGYPHHIALSALIIFLLLLKLVTKPIKKDRKVE